MTSARTVAMVGVWLLVFLCAPVLSESNVGLDQDWDLWKETHQKKYLSEEEELSRRAVWEKNLLKIERHNQEATLGLHSYTLGVNHMSDLTKEEIMRIYAPLRIPKGIECENETFSHVRDVDLPPTKDWRDKDWVTPVKDQGSCGSCWAFSTVGALEGLLANTSKELVNLSPQNLVDCSRDYGNFGCGGGLMDKALKYVIDNKGIAKDKDYPYKAEDDACKNVSSKIEFDCLKYSCVCKTELALQAACAAIGPIAVAIDAGEMAFYKSGVFSECGESFLNHGVLLVGYGTDETNGLEYWLIKNSWGEMWGEDGYIRLARNKNQMCGISTYAVYPYLDQKCG